MNFTDVYTKVRSRTALARAHQTVERIAGHESWAQGMTDESLASEFCALASASEDERVAKGFALVREAARRTLGLRHFDVQLVGGLVLLNGMLAEMRTGEGKTLTITAPAAVLALHGKGVHVVTANSYLAQRDAELMRPVYEALGLTVAAVYPDQPLEERQLAYACDITYGVGSDFGFDYLKDHLVPSKDRQVQRGHFAAIVDEVDSILIDEARVPMIISEQASDMAETVRLLDQCIRGLQPELHYLVNVKERSAHLTEAGYRVVEQALVASGSLKRDKDLYDETHLPWVRRLHAAVHAYALFRKDRDYVIEDGELVLVDTGTGRKMPGRRLEEGLHEALEAREGLPVQRGSVTKATITYQNFFGLYERLSGLSGTALTDAEEFTDIYGLETVVIPPNKAPQRKHHEDLVYLTKAEKFAAAVEEARTRSAAGQPVLLGVATIRDAEVLDVLLTKAGVPHETLTAKHIAREAHIIASAGRPGAVTVATNMAGRGTDIALGGEKPEASAFADAAAHQTAVREWEATRRAVQAAGGLYVLGTERNGIRRVDNQLAGRSGRQGDPGEVQFLLSLEDDLLKTFGQSKQLALIRRMLEAAGTALGGKTIGKLIESAQKSVENQGFSARKNLMQFDSVLSEQRLVVYRLRDELLGEGAVDHLRACVLDAVESWIARNMPKDSDPETWAAGELKRSLLADFGLNLPVLSWVNKEDATAESIAGAVREAARQQLESVPLTETDARTLVLDVLDASWTDHLSALDELRQNVSLKGKTGQNPVYQFHRDAFELFASFESQVCLALAGQVLNKVQRDDRAKATTARQAAQDAAAKVAMAIEKRWVARNDACPCGSGERFRLCHGRLA